MHIDLFIYNFVLYIHLNFFTYIQFKFHIISVHEDEPPANSTSLESINLFHGFSTTNLDNFSDWLVPMTIPEPEDPKKIPMYPKHKIYCNNKEYSLEEVIAKKYIKRPVLVPIQQNSPTHNAGTNKKYLTRSVDLPVTSFNGTETLKKENTKKIKVFEDPQEGCSKQFFQEEEEGIPKKKLKGLFSNSSKALEDTNVYKTFAINSEELDKDKVSENDEKIEMFKDKFQSDNEKMKLDYDISKLQVEKDHTKKSNLKMTFSIFPDEDSETSNTSNKSNSNKIQIFEDHNENLKCQPNFSIFSDEKEAHTEGLSKNVSCAQGNEKSYENLISPLESSLQNEEKIALLPRDRNFRLSRDKLRKNTSDELKSHVRSLLARQPNETLVDMLQTNKKV